MAKELKTDTEMARKANLKLYSTKNIGWLNLNAGAIIALITVIFTFGLWFAMLSGFSKGLNDNILFAINSGASMAIGFILSYYFGSSNSRDNEPNNYSTSTSSSSSINDMDKDIEEALTNLPDIK